jgi:hypothetical protein
MFPLLTVASMAHHQATGFDRVRHSDRMGRSALWK